MTNHKLMLDLDDPRTAGIAEVLSNKTCKKILSILAEKEQSTNEIAGLLKLPLTTVDYNIQKLMKVELIEETSGVFWSVKGKKVKRYTVSDKTLIISPKSKFNGVLTALGLSGIIGIAIKYWQDSQIVVQETVQQVAMKSAEMVYADSSIVSDGINGVNQTMQNNSAWWFILGSLVALMIVLVLNWRKI